MKRPKKYICVSGFSSEKVKYGRHYYFIFSKILYGIYGNCVNLCHLPVYWFDFCFTALQHILGHFGRGQLPLSHCSWASLLGSLPVLSAHSFASNWQSLFLNQRKRENGRRNVFMTMSPRKNVLDVGIELGAACMQNGLASDRATVYICFFFSIKCLGLEQKPKYGKFFFSSNTLAVRTPKIILKLLLKTFSFSSNSDFFHAVEFLILRTLKMQERMLELHKTMPNL